MAPSFLWETPLSHSQFTWAPGLGLACQPEGILWSWHLVEGWARELMYSSVQEGGVRPLFMWDM